MKLTEHNLIPMKLIVCIGIISILVVATSFAYWSSTLNHKNELHADSIKGEIQETFDKNSKPYGTVDKLVYFKNDNSANAFLRVVDVEYWSSVNGDETTLLPNKVKGTEVATKNWTPDFSNTNLWEKGSDGWYYYKRILRPNESTDPILSSVTFPEYTGDHSNYKDADYHLYFRMELLQASSSEYTLNSSEVNENAGKTVFGRKASVDKNGNVTWQ